MDEGIAVRHLTHLSFRTGGRPFWVLCLAHPGRVLNHDSFNKRQGVGRNQNIWRILQALKVCLLILPYLVNGFCSLEKVDSIFIQSRITFQSLYSCGHQPVSWDPTVTLLTKCCRSYLLMNSIITSSLVRDSYLSSAPARAA